MSCCVLLKFIIFSPLFNLKILLKDKRHFELLFKDNYTRLYYYALNFLNDSEAARDIVNDVFEYVWRHYEHYELSVSLSPFLYTLVRNQAVSFIRHRKVEEKYQQRFLSDEEVYEHEYAEHDELIFRLRKAIAELPAQTQNVFRACFLEDKKYQEAADELNISVNTVKTHIKKALRLLRESFGGDSFVLLFIHFLTCRKSTEARN